MQLITFAGPPSSGKSAVIIQTIRLLHRQGIKTGVVKFDALSTLDDQLYQKHGIPVKTGRSGGICPDHFFVTNIDDCLQWGLRHQFDMLISESAGLCNRCAPHIKNVTAICVIDALSGIHTPQKMGPMLKMADFVVITKGDIVSQAEREVFSYYTQLANPKAEVFFCNGLTGQGALELASQLQQSPHLTTLNGYKLRFPMPAAVCPYCVGETAIGPQHQRGHLKKMQFEEMCHD
ncbi:GTP-binding protein [Tolumonas lignilytica]|jgi:Ni2+-binding GTPase involved in regulation of expression and maturation of urease and hydrogenase|uniref:GTP-binding protein n=1 Tax=Tolumonas lignilytica TaxID=1283284 RepID=UPI000464D509|nr:GTP-binding protein [Tolumonas lignilytica]